MADRPISGRQDALRGPTPRPPRREDDTTRRIESDEITPPYQSRSPAEISQVSELLSAAGEELFARFTARLEERLGVVLPTPPPKSGDSVSMPRSTRTSYRVSVVGLASALVLLVGWIVGQVVSYGDSRESAARATIAAEAKAAEAARYAEDTRKVAETAAARADVLERKLDLVLAKLERMESPR